MDSLDMLDVFIVHDQESFSPSSVVLGRKVNKLFFLSLQQFSTSCNTKVLSSTVIVCKMINCDSCTLKLLFVWGNLS